MANRTGLVTARRLNVRPGPSTEKPPVASLPRGTRVELLEAVAGWYRIRAGSVHGYVSGDYITVIDETPVADYLWEMELLRTTPLTPPPEKAIPLLSRHTAGQKMAAGTWNRQGGLLELL